MTDYRTADRPLTREATAHSTQIAWRCVEHAMKTLGEGWKHVSDDVRWGLVSAQILSVVVGQHAFDNEKATDSDLANVARYTHELWVAGMAIQDSGWRKPWGKV